MLKHTVSNIMHRLYSTELRAHNDPTSLSALQAIRWLIRRNTIGKTPTSHKTTRHDAGMP